MLADRAAWRRRVVEALTRGDDTGRVETLRRGLQEYADELARAGLTGGEVADAYPARAVVRYVLREGRALLLGLPAAVWGIVTHGVPYHLTALLARALRPEPELAATYKLGIGLALYPLSWLAEGWLAWWWGGPWLLALFCAGLVPAGFIALTWTERLDRVRRQTRGFLRFLIDRDRHGHLVARRRTLVRQLRELMEETPAPVAERHA